MWKTFSSPAFDMRHFCNMRGSASTGARSPAQAEPGPGGCCPHCCSSRISIYRQGMDVDATPRSHPVHPQTPPTYPEAPGNLGTGPKAELVPMAPRCLLRIQGEVILHVSCLPVLSSCQPPADVVGHGEGILAVLRRRDAV